MKRAYLTSQSGQAGRKAEADEDYDDEYCAQSGQAGRKAKADENYDDEHCAQSGRLGHKVGSRN